MNTHDQKKKSDKEQQFDKELDNLLEKQKTKDDASFGSKSTSKKHSPMFDVGAISFGSSNKGTIPSIKVGTSGK